MDFTDITDLHGFLIEKVMILSKVYLNLEVKKFV